ncbi:MAG: hypothetical protein Kow00114_27260 [Kiloniellaceae bacterium]
MGGPVPTLGYPSRTACILALREEGKTVAEIAAAIGIPEHRVNSLDWFGTQARKRRRGPLSYDVDGPAVEFPGQMLDSLKPAARRRGMGVHHLVRKLVEKIVEDGLVEAVLDDAAAAPGSAAGNGEEEASA